jgi:hypothetical protein
MWQSVSPLFPPEFTRRSGSGGMVRPAIICHLSCDMLIPEFGHHLQRGHEQAIF